MRKIPTVFRRDPEEPSRVLSDVMPGCEWVLAGEGTATRKYDGTCCMLDSDGRWWARREVKAGKPAPSDFIVADRDEATGKTQGWVPMESSPWAKWHAQALDDRAWAAGTYELCGPKVNGNPERLGGHVLIAHAHAEELFNDDRTFEGIRMMVRALGDQGVEGIVWHHPDGRMAKIKVRDFG